MQPKNKDKKLKKKKEKTKKWYNDYKKVLIKIWKNIQHVLLNSFTFFPIGVKKLKIIFGIENFFHPLIILNNQTLSLEIM